MPEVRVRRKKTLRAREIPSQSAFISPMRMRGGIRVSIIPIAQAAPLVPAALAAGKVAAKAAGSFAQMLRDALASSATAPVSSATKPTGQNWPENLSVLMRDFASAFQRLLSDHNLHSTSPVALQLDSLGEVKVQGDHPERLAIENLLAKTPSLSELFRSIAEKATSHRKEQEFAAFQTPSRSGTEDFPLLFSQEHAPKFQMLMDGPSATATFA
jgi:hypothetical protein